MTRTASLYFLVAISIASFGARVHSAPGDLDPSFGNGGFIVHGTEPFYWELRRVVVQPSGKILFGVEDNFIGYAGLQRLNANGTLDTSFGVNGTLFLGESGLHPFALLANGKLLVSVFGEVQLYSADGVFESIVFQQAGYISYIDVRPDGRFLTVGGSYTNFNLCTFTRRLQNGDLDQSFGTNGTITIEGEGWGIWIDELADGSYVSKTSFSFPNYALIKFTASGQRDMSFGVGGRVILPGYGLGHMAALPDGKFLLYDVPFSEPRVGAVVRRYFPNGILDSSFAANGELVIDTPSGTQASGDWLQVKPNGKIVLAVNGDVGFRVMKFNPNGTPDLGFGVNGSAPVPGGTPLAVNLVAENKILVSGIGFGGNMFARLLDSSAAPFDFDGDYKTDLGVVRFNDSSLEWWINRSTNGSNIVLTLGAGKDVPVPADFTGDGKLDVAVFSFGDYAWHIVRSENSTVYTASFGTFGDWFVPRDYDSDGKADLAVFRPSNGTWWIQRSTAGLLVKSFGLSGDLPIPADYDGDRKADAAVFRPADGTWWIDGTSAGPMVVTFGVSTDKLVPGDYTGDGKTDVAVWRPSDGNWYVLRSENSSYYGFPWGVSTDVPVPGDYDGDGRWDAAVFRAGTWYVNRTTGTPLITSFGIDGDRPIPNAYVP